MTENSGQLNSNLLWRLRGLTVGSVGKLCCFQSTDDLGGFFGCATHVSFHKNPRNRRSVGGFGANISGVVRAAMNPDMNPIFMLSSIHKATVSTDGFRFLAFISALTNLLDAPFF